MVDRMDSTNAQTLSTVQSVQKTLIRLTERVDRQEATVHALQAKVFGPERGSVVEARAGFSSRARPRYPQTDANNDNNISHRNSHTVSHADVSVYHSIIFNILPFHQVRAYRISTLLLAHLIINIGSVDRPPMTWTLVR